MVDALDERRTISVQHLRHVLLGDPGTRNFTVGEALKELILTLSVLLGALMPAQPQNT